MNTNYIKCGNCYDLIKTLPDKSVDLIITDPPYEINIVGGGLYKQQDKQYVKELEHMKNGFSNEVLEEFCRVLKKINIYIWCSQKQLKPLIDFFVGKKKCNFNLITWHKTNPIPACGNKYLSDTEYCLFFREKGVKIYGTFGTKFTYYITPINVNDKKLYKHPTIKPLEIIENLVINSSKIGDVVLDPFIGSGTTAIACIKHDRKYIGFELNEEYYNTCCKRIEKETNKNECNTKNTK